MQTTVYSVYKYHPLKGPRNTTFSVSACPLLKLKIWAQINIADFPVSCRSSDRCALICLGPPSAVISPLGWQEWVCSNLFQKVLWQQVAVHLHPCSDKILRDCGTPPLICLQYGGRDTHEREKFGEGISKLVCPRANKTVLLQLVPLIKSQLRVGTTWSSHVVPQPMRNETPLKKKKKRNCNWSYCWLCSLPFFPFGVAFCFLPAPLLSVSVSSCRVKRREIVVNFWQDWGKKRSSVAWKGDTVLQDNKVLPRGNVCWLGTDIWYELLFLLLTCCLIQLLLQGKYS